MSYLEAGSGKARLNLKANREKDGNIRSFADGTYTLIPNNLVNLRDKEQKRYK